MFWKKKLPLPPLADGERDIFVELYVDLSTPVPDPDDPQETCDSYSHWVGLRLREKDPKLIIEHVASDGNVDWSLTEWKDVVPSDLGREFRDDIQPPDHLGVWYRGEKVFI